MFSSAKVGFVYRYPVKGLSPESLQRARLAAGETVPGDCIYAIENGPSGFDPAAPRHQPKMRYLMLMRNERLATLRTSFDDKTHTLAIGQKGAKPCAAICARPRGGPPSSRSSGGSALTSCADCRSSCTRRATASPMSPARSFRSSISPRSSRLRPPRERRSIRCGSAAMSTSRAGRRGTSSTSVGGELLVTLTQGQRLRGLHEAAGAVRQFFDVHASLPQPARSALSARPEHPPRVSRHGGAQSVARKGPPRWSSQETLPAVGMSRPPVKRIEARWSSQ